MSMSCSVLVRQGFDDRRYQRPLGRRLWGQRLKGHREPDHRQGGRGDAGAVEPAIGAVYAAVLIDAIMVKIRDGQVGNRPGYAAIGVDLDGNKDILGRWAGDGGGEPAKFWMSVLTDLRNRGVADVFFVVCAPGRRPTIRVSSSYWLSSVGRNGAGADCCSPRTPS